MDKTYLLTLLFFSTTAIIAQSPCSDESVMAVKGSWKKRPDQNMRPDKNQAEINKRLASISKLFQAAYPDPKGTDANWYATMDGTPLINNGAVVYNFNSLYLAWYCNQHLQKIMPGTETGTWAYVAVNSFNWFISGQYDRLAFTINQKPVYQMPLQKGKWKGHDVYEPAAYGDKSRCIILTRNNALPWIFISQEQYLEATQMQWQVQKQHYADNYITQEEMIKKSILSNKQNNTLKDTQRAAVNNMLEKQLDNLLQTKDQTLARLNKDLDEKINIVDHYLNQASPAVLQGPAIVDKGSGGGFKGSFSTIEKGGRLLVSTNEEYFDAKLPHYMPQLMVLCWRWDNKVTGLEFKKQLEENFEIEKLQAMLDK